MFLLTLNGFQLLEVDDFIHPIQNEKFINSFSFGFDIETGGHVFQLFFSNSTLCLKEDSLMKILKIGKMVEFILDLIFQEFLILINEKN